jgi:UDP-2,3-diacylglucosamine pyrophosphatase LpxH
MPTDIQLLSDLHLEVERGDQPLYTLDFPACAPNLALLGDIGWTRDERLFIWLELQLTRFERVFFISGNHEPYVGTLVSKHAESE